jgi:hypothetical protein
VIFLSSKYQDKILEQLEHETTLENLIKKTGISYDKIRNPLAALLNKGKIQISDFQRQDKFSLYKIKFEKQPPHTTFIDILTLLQQLENKNPKKVEKSMKTLKKCYKQKNREYEKQETKFYQQILEKTKSQTLSSWIQQQQKILEIMTQERTFGRATLKKEIQIWKETLKKEPNSIIWHIQNLTLPEYNRILQIKNQPSYTELAPQITQTKINDITQDPTVTATEFLSIHSLDPPIIQTTDQTHQKFINLLFHINTHSNPEFMKQCFARALSQEKNSTYWYELFTKHLNQKQEQITENTLKTQLGIPKHEDWYTRLGRDPYGRKLQQ